MMFETTNDFDDSDDLGDPLMGLSENEFKRLHGKKPFPPTLMRYLDEEYPAQPKVDVGCLQRQLASIMAHLKELGFWK